MQKEKLQIVSIFRFGHKKRGLFQCPLKAWSESKVQSTKLNIIMSLSLYGEKGMEEFERLERECTDKDDSFLFKQVRVFDSYIKNLAR